MANRKTHYQFDGKTLIVGGNLLAYLLNPEKPYSRTTIAKWCEKGMPFQKRGRIKEYNFLEVYKWLWDNENNLDLLNAEKIKQQTKQSAAQTEKIELQNKEAKRKLISIDELSSSQDALIDTLMRKDVLHVKRCTNPKLKEELEKHYKTKWDELYKEAKIAYENSSS